MLPVPAFDLPAVQPSEMADTAMTITAAQR
jgi:hypothetical protein